MDHQNRETQLALRCLKGFQKRVEEKKPGLFFLYGYRGTGKTYILRAMSAALRTKCEIVLTVVSSGIAALLILVGYTTEKEKKNFPFGGKAVVLGGDFRQILPVIPKGTRQEVVNSTIYSSRFCEVLTLTTRLQTGSSDSDIEDEKNFSDWILGIGDGSIGQSNDSDITIQIPLNLLVPNLGDPLSTIVQSTYPDLLHNMNDPTFFKDRAILAPKTCWYVSSTVNFLPWLTICCSVNNNFKERLENIDNR
ncbi:uncharacterized protein LOC123914670 [Trifolium pratense]|uniref:uncharacterized protein LOC123914670 n=1 Tax=Trifolium pratense TaxID=57577 RepID=UPI001E691FE1|nr:uncharacterized protein LOC123914670 [Trifolium pratense]